MRELYLVACGVLIGMSLADWIERWERRIAWQAADHAAELTESRRTFAQHLKEGETSPTPA